MARTPSFNGSTHRVHLGLILFAVCSLFLQGPILAQSKSSESLLTRLAAKATGNLSVSFTYTPRYPTQGQPVQFTAKSSGAPQAFAWDFGDGTSSREQNPVHVYTETGFRKVTVVASTTAASRKASRTLTVLPAAAQATFVFSPATPGPGQAVQFSDTTSGTPTSWRWSFGDGATSTVKNPSHAFASEGTYTVSLTTGGGTGTKQGSRTIAVASMSVLAASFTFSPAFPTTGQAIQFADTSTGSPTSWLWNFGDGTTSSAQNPSHAYAAAGSKTVTLTITSATSSNTSTRTISVATPLAASLSFSPAAPTAGQAVQFTDASTGAPTSWLWNFGDGTTSAVQNPSHAYAAAGSKTVTLTVTNATGSNSASRTFSVSASLTASFTFSPASPVAGQSVQFTDASTGSPTAWSWSFGDGGTSTARNPSHAFASAGTYTVRLTASNGSGQSEVSLAVTVTASNTVTASFGFSPSAPAAGDTVQFTDSSTGSPTSWQWSFGDGGTSTAQNPSHAYAAAGTYTVSLTAASGSSSATATRAVTVAAAAALDASFSYAPSSPAPGQAVSFTDTSTASPASWQWNFGDGGTSSAQNPSHTFAAAGSYTVTLLAAGLSGSDTASRTITVATSTSLLPDDRIIDWTSVGVPGGIPNRTTVYRTLTPSNTLAEINAAIAACPSGQVVFLAAGSYSLGQITFGSRSGVTLRGAGAGRTVINATSGYAVSATELSFFEADGVDVAGGYVKGSTTITLAATPSSAFAVGNLIQITQDDSPDALGSTGVGVYHRTGFPGVWGMSATRNVRFTSRITAVSGTRITLATAVPYTYQASLNPKAYPLSGGPGATLCGVESLTIRGSGSTDRAVNFSGTDRCWVKDVEVDNMVGTTGMIFFRHSFQGEIQRCYAHDAAGFPSQADGYAYFFYYGCSNCLAVDNIACRVGDGLIINGSSASACLYNLVENVQRAGHAWVDQGMIVNHGPHAIMNLIEGNVLQRFQNDGYHGSTSHTLLFRNNIHGLRDGASGVRRLIDLCRGSYYHTLVGNVIGDSSWTPAYYQLPANPASVSGVYVLGFPGMDSISMAAYTSVPWDNWTKSTTAPDADVAATILRHGNYDYYNRSVVWDPAISSQSIPASLVYSSKPDFFGTLQWPPIGPDVSGLVTSIPAKARWNAYLASGDVADLFRVF